LTIIYEVFSHHRRYNRVVKAVADPDRYTLDYRIIVWLVLSSKMNVTDMHQDKSLAQPRRW